MESLTFENSRVFGLPTQTDEYYFEFHYYTPIIVHNNVPNIKIMLIATLSDFRKNIKHYVDSVIDNFETLIINRGKDSGIVIMSLDEYNSLCATQHEMSSVTNKKRLDSAIEKLKSKDSFEKDLLS
ncbi:type II toxin-antitoxin system Phd/YefM family antitoxin [Reichenbachiella agariperforans]|uniref:type II toxin-antitoxin system Phd/YefM family antitoxin n=1 Tax=Reichenbachiella agariperforans TaxID=156994 RepID=UPI002091C2CC|nr:type II toxin-antitoxin system Phd/YefM family antitoxin [Reichenbachiella agariperforans]